MAKWVGIIAFAEDVETEPGIWTEQITERKYIGDLIRNSRSLGGSNQINDSVMVNNEISIVSDPYVTQYFHKIRWITFLGSKYKVSSVDIEYPRMTLRLGEIYRENQG